jgi:O6-methylguanine-DNA--protein-cysteine methyltransferase
MPKSATFKLDKEQTRRLKDMLMDYKQIILFSQTNADASIKATRDQQKEAEVELKNSTDPEKTKVLVESLNKMKEYIERAKEDMKHLDIALNRRQELYDLVLDFLEIKKTDDVDSLTDTVVQEVHAGEQDLQSVL